VDQFTIRASNGVRMTENAGENKSIGMGERYRDNAIVAWGRVTSGGTATEEFGVVSVSNPSTGTYNVTLDASAASSVQLIPIAIAEVDSPPTSATAARLVTVNQTGINTFTVYITNGSFTPTNNEFVFMVTGR
jgi:hypothetical protein